MDEDPRRREETAGRHHVMRVLRRQRDGDWKVHRTIWNTAAPSGE